MNTTAIDGRTTRWEEHNAQRRKELVDSALRAIRHHGAGVGMDVVATEAGTSKPVLYRHFGGRTGLYSAIVESVHQFIWSHLQHHIAGNRDMEPAELVRELTDTYLALVERDPHIYQFVVTRPLGESPVEDPVTGITGRIGNEIAEVFRLWLRASGLDPRAANTWGHGVVGFVWAIADKWITTGHQRPRADIVEFTVNLFEPAFLHQQITPRSPDRSSS